MKDYSQFLKPFGIAFLLMGMLAIGCATLSHKAPPPPTPEVVKPAPKIPEPMPPKTESLEPAPFPSSPPILHPPASKIPKPVHPGPASPVEAEATYFTHTVRYSGESVSIIAAWYTGDLENWKILAEANPKIDPNRINIGNKILVPENMMKTRELMPREFVDSFYEKGKLLKKPAKTVSPSKKDKEEEPELFGPKSLPKK